MGVAVVAINSRATQVLKQLRARLRPPFARATKRLVWVTARPSPRGGRGASFSVRAALLSSAILAPCTPALAATIPEDRADALYHSYDGGGVTITGPSVLVRKGYKDKVSVYANVYVDMVSSASIDVVTQGSPYSEERTEYSLGADYLHDKTTISFGGTSSRESDYEADTGHFGISQSFFGDLTTVTMGYAHGEDTVGMNVEGRTLEVGEAKRRRFSLGLTQILTRNWIAALATESVIDDGFLNNPYRQVRDTTSGTFLSKEHYPTTRNSDAIALRSLYFLPYRASVRLEGRYYSDSWDIEGQQIELRYTHPLPPALLFELKARSYSQSQAFFYHDIIDYSQGIPEFYARDKELSDFKSFNIGLGVTYDLQKQWRFVEKQTLSLYVDFMRFDYENFRDARLSRSATGDAVYAPGEEPAYAFDANIIRLFYSAYY